MQGATLVGFHDAHPERARAGRERAGRAPRSIRWRRCSTTWTRLTIVVPTPGALRSRAARRWNAGSTCSSRSRSPRRSNEADELLALARANRLLVQIGHVERFNRAIRAALPYRATRRGSSRATAWRRSTRAGADVAVVLDLMIHDIDLVHTLVRRSRGRRARGRRRRCSRRSWTSPTHGSLSSRGAVANITASRVSRDRMRKLRIFQRSGYLSLDLGGGHRRVLPAAAATSTSPALAKAPQSLEEFVERIPLKAPEGEPLRLELESFLAAIRGDAPVAVSGEDGRDALAVALRIVQEIERTLPALRGPATATPSVARAVREILFVAGETSGDLHAAGVARELAAAIAAGRRSRCAGSAAIAWRRRVSSSIEHIRRSRRAWASSRSCGHSRSTGDRCAIFARASARGASPSWCSIDYPGFNMRSPRRPRDAGVPVLYYITPQVWAWGADRLAKMARWITQGGRYSAVRGGAAARRTGSTRRSSAIRCSIEPCRCPRTDERAGQPRSSAGRAGARAVSGKPGAGDRAAPRRLSCGPRELLRAADPSLHVIVSAAPHVRIDASAMSLSAGALRVAGGPARRRRGAVQERNDDARSGRRRMSARRRVSRAAR